MKIKQCRICLVKTGPHNVRNRTELQYHICNVCEDMEDKRRRKELKINVLNHYGGKCVCCGTTTMEFLSMDHINGDGSIDRKLGMADHIWNWIKKNNYPESLQILCFNCNMAKAHNGYCPHEMYYHLRRRRSGSGSGGPTN